ncbi:MAG: histidinol dehydrogenase [Victivallaceae bacterium]|nr:histidinol dehydrogenase [Victivallaceae bacterium]
MQIINCTQAGFEPELDKIYRREAVPPEVDEAVKDILAEIKRDGDTALTKFAEKFDRIKLSPAQFRVSDQDIAAAESGVSAEWKNAITSALANIVSFAEQRIPKDWKYSPRPGVVIGERFEPMERIGVYIPGGTAPLVSTVLHTAGIAKAAGVKEIVAVTPPGQDGMIHPAVLWAMRKAGVNEIYRLGGVYGVGALAYGTATIRKVDKIVGPGNAWVTAAKKQVYGHVALDMVAGPSEIMIIADDSARADFIAADMLSQAEHGSGLEHAVLVTTDAGLIEKVQNELDIQKQRLSRGTMVDKVLKDGVSLILVKELADAIEIAGKYAPEHLEIMCRDAESTAGKIKAAGAIFIGEWTPEPVGDFCAGPSHVLPTAGSGRYFSGLTVEGFFRRMSTIQYTQTAIQQEIPVIAAFSEMEGLDAHGNSGKIRGSK